MGNIFSKAVIKAITGNVVSDELLKSMLGTKELKKEVQKVLQRANRRAQNIENAGLPSPALKTLYAERGSKARGYSKFSITGLNINDETEWIMIKQEYGRAMAFLNNPTSTALGTREYIRNVASEYTNNHFESAVKLVDVATNPQISENGRINAFNYGSVLEVFKSDVMKAGNEMDLDAENFAEELEKKLEDALNRADESNIATQFLKMFGNGVTLFK